MSICLHDHELDDIEPGRKDTELSHLHIIVGQSGHY